MLSKRIIPCLDVNHGRVVKGITFTGLRDAGDPVELAAVYNREGADERHRGLLSLAMVGRRVARCQTFRKPGAARSEPGEIPGRLQTDRA